jgi:predicted GNAT family acetyltransferase
MDHALQESQSPLGETLEVVHHEDERFYELVVDGQFGGLLVYGLGDNRIVFTHTFIAEGYRGRGLSNFMIESTLDDVRAHGFTVTNFCPVLDHFFETHPGYIPLIDERVPGTWSRRDHESGTAKQEPAPTA